MEKMMRALLLVTLLATLAACGMGKAASDSARMGDKYACLARQLKGQQCTPDAAPQPPARDPTQQQPVQ